MSHNISKIFYINLEKRTDRRQEIESELNNFGLDYERFNAFHIPDFGSLGCGLSHLEVLKIAKERNYENVLILEDDFKFLVTKEEFEEELTKFFDLKLDYDVCMISYNVLESDETEYPFLRKVLDAQTTSGYIVNKKYFDKLIELDAYAAEELRKTKMHWIYAVDQIWKRYQKTDNWYYFSKRIGKQRASWSDCANTFVDMAHC